MSRIKIIFFCLFVAVALAAGVWAYFELRKSKRPDRDALSMVPAGCILYLRTGSFFELDKKINSQSLISDRLQLFKEVNWLCEQLHRFDSLFAADPAIREQLVDNAIHFSLYKNNNWLIAFNLKELGLQEMFRKKLNGLLKSSPVGNYQNFRLDKTNTANFHVEKGIAVFSNGPELIERYFSSEEKFADTEVYQTFKATLSENKLLSVYLDHKAFSSEEAGKKILLSALTPAGYSAGSLDLTPSEFKINGFLLLDSSGHHSVPHATNGETKNIATRMPKGTTFFKAIVTDPVSLLNEGDTSNSVFWDHAEKRALFNVKKQFADNIREHVFEFETSGDLRYVSIAIEDEKKTEEAIQYMSDSVLVFDSLRVFRLDGIGHGRIFPTLITKQNFCVLTGGELYFSATSESAVQLSRSLRRGATLWENESFRNYMLQHMPDKFHTLVYCSPAANKKMAGEFLKLKANSDPDPFENLRHFSHCLIAEEDIFKFRTHLLYETAEKQKNLLWTLELDADCSVTPAAFVNHYSKENELIVQDADNMLYLINAKGVIQFKTQLPEKIRSEIYMVDAFRNNKFQMLFSTESALHLIDRNGHYVDNYPIKLPSPATAPLSLFDYENTKEYRLFIPCANKTIYNFDINGKKTEGFSPVKTEQPVNLPVQYMQVGVSQYLVAIDTEGKIYTFSRKGIGRIGLRNNAVRECRKFYVDEGGTLSGSSIIYVDDKNALLNKITLADVKSVAKLGGDVEEADVKFRLVDENRSMDLLITKGEKVQAFDFSGHLIFEKTGPENLSQSDIYSDESHSFIYGFSESEQKVRIFDLLNETSSALDASMQPLLLKLFNNDKKYLIVPEGKKVHCLLME